MLLGGMEAVNELVTTAEKLFESFCTIYWGVIFPIVGDVLLAPIVLRFMPRNPLRTEDVRELRNG
jgi:hypothetical protein